LREKARGDEPTERRPLRARFRGGSLAAAAIAPLAACASSPAPPPAEPVVVIPAVAEAPCATGDPDAPLTFPDANLLLAVRRALGLERFEPLTCGAARELRSLHAPDARIRDLTGIEVLVALEELYIYGNNDVTDIRPLVGLSSLRDLSLARTEIEDISPLAELSSLTSLSLYGNPIHDIRPLAALTRLTRLQVEHAAGVSDLSALSGLRSLTRLELSGNGIVDLTPLAGLAALTWLSLEENPQLSDISPLRHLGRLEILSLGGTAVVDLGPLAALSRLGTLALHGTAIVDLGPLIGLAHLSRLDLRDNRQLVDIQSLLFNTHLGRADAVRLERTGVRCEDVASLRSKGVSVLARC
jgi:Leucine-rich repeat (LRR) protein